MIRLAKLGEFALLMCLFSTVMMTTSVLSALAVFESPWEVLEAIGLDNLARINLAGGALMALGAMLGPRE